MKYLISMMLILASFFVGGYTFSTKEVQTVSRNVEKPVYYVKYYKQLSDGYWNQGSSKAFKMVESACHKAYHHNGQKLCVLVMNLSEEPFKTDAQIISLGILTLGEGSRSISISNSKGTLEVKDNSQHYCAVSIDDQPKLQACWNEGNWPESILNSYFSSELQGSNPVLWQFPVQVEPTPEPIVNQIFEE